jgi:beta-aspartyl-dipeptidase (metallo-type)
MVILIRGAEVFSPEPLGVKDVFLAGQKIIAVAEPQRIHLQGLDCRIMDASGLILCPGFIDSHVHIIGGGGEGGPATRSPEIKLEDIITSGVTTVIGCLGTDGVTRHMESLLAKAFGLEKEGISTFLYTGSYEIPVHTLTGSVRSDLILIEKVIGAGEIAISDHRSSQPDFHEFARLAAECRVGGMLGGKAGILHCHLGDGSRRLELIFRLLEETEIPPAQIVPTHANRNPGLMDEAVTLVQQGGTIDLTADLDPNPPEDQQLSVAMAVERCLAKNASLDRVTVSSDGNGSLPVFNEQGVLTGLTVASEKSLLANFRYLIRNKIVSIDQALKLFSTNSASCYKLAGKGRIEKGFDGDLILLDKELQLVHVLAKGRIMIEDSVVKATGTFSAPS